MFSFNRNIFRLQTHIKFLIRHFTSSSANSFSSVETTFEENCDKILHILNTSTPETLLRLEVSHAHVKDIIKCRTERGSFKSLVDVLQVNGMGDNILKKICDKIIKQDYARLQTTAKKQIKNIITPDIKASMIFNLQSAVAIHVDTIGVSWARLSKTDNTLTDWHYEHFRNIPEKLSPAGIFELALHVVEKTPSADVYVFETLPVLNMQNKSKPSTVYSHNQQTEILSMLLALLNTSKVHNKDLCVGTSEDSRPKIENKVFYIRSYIPARLFKTFIGSEKVSSTVTVSEFLIPTFTRSVNLCCTPVTLTSDLKEMYMKQGSVGKELLSQAVMLGCAFMDLCIYKNQDTLKALQGGKKKTK
ncbi:uncharacterized protein LOC143198657 [Rhynchophorus ferrugineus]